MPGFVSGFAQGMAGLPEALDRRDQLKMRQLAEARQFTLDQQRIMGEDLKTLGEALPIASEEQVPFLLGTFFDSIKNATGEDIPANVKSEFKRDWRSAIKSLQQMYVDQPFDAKGLGKVLGNPRALAGAVTALNRREMAIQQAAAYQGGPPQPPAGVGGVGPQSFPVAPQNDLGTSGGIGGGGEGNEFPGVFDMRGMQKRLAGLHRRIEALGSQVGGDPDRQKNLMTDLREQAKLIQDQMKQVYSQAEVSAAGRLGFDPTKMTPQQRQLVQREALMQMGLAEQSKKAGEVAATPLSVEQLQSLPSPPPLGTTMGMIQEQNAGRGGGGMRTGNPQIDAIAQTESNFNPFAVSPKGARGVMQVMPGTNASPGFGVQPAQNASEAERTRVGREYFGAMKQEFGGNDTLGFIAYNMGPEKTRKWLDAGGDFTKLPKETREYVAAAVTRTAVNQVVPQRQVAGPQANVPMSKALQAQEETTAKSFGNEATEIMKQGRMAIGKRRKMEQLGSMLGKVDTGTLANATLMVQKAGKAFFGIDIPATASYAEASKALSAPLVMGLRDPSQGGGLPGNFSDADREFLKSAIASIDKEPGTIKILVSAYVNAMKNDEAISKLVQDYKKENGRYDEGMYQKIDEYLQANPIFSEADAKKLVAEPPKSSIRQPAKVEPPKSWSAEKRSEYEAYKAQRMKEIAR